MVFPSLDNATLSKLGATSSSIVDSFVTVHSVRSAASFPERSWIAFSSSPDVGSV